MSEPNKSAAPIAHRSPNERLGMVLFALYLLLYGGFIVIAVYDYQIMGKVVFAGINLAIAYGMLLIVAAIVLAVLYACLAKPDTPDGSEAADI